MTFDINKIFNSMKGTTSAGSTLSASLNKFENLIKTMEPGDVARQSPRMVMAAPIGYDLWYLNCHDNLFEHYFPGIDGNHYDYSAYLAEKYDFLGSLTGLKPIKTLRDLAQITSISYFNVSEMRDVLDWSNNGIYWVNSIAYELFPAGMSLQYDSIGPKGFSKNDYVGYFSFPVGQLGVMEVIALLYETDLSGYLCIGRNVKNATAPQGDEMPSVQTPPLMFPEMEGAGENHCYGKHLIESGHKTADGEEMTVEWMSSVLEKYKEDVKPKKWMRYWIHKDSKFPVPGEFVGALTKTLAVPPHVWWFQESNPFLYAGNWVETFFLTSGVVIAVIPKESRTDGKEGNQYTVKIQDCKVKVEATDFLLYNVGDRVAVLKVGKVSLTQETSYTWLDLETFTESDEGTEQPFYVIMPAVFYPS